MVVIMGDTHIERRGTLINYSHIVCLSINQRKNQITLM